MMLYHPSGFIKILLSLLLGFGGLSQLFAKHIVGGEIYYECLGPGNMTDSRNYKLTMKIYRDCAADGANFDNPARIGIYSHINGVYAFVTALNVNHIQVTTVIQVSKKLLRSFVVQGCAGAVVYIKRNTQVIKILFDDGVVLIYNSLRRSALLHRLYRYGRAMLIAAAHKHYIALLRAQVAHINIRRQVSPRQVANVLKAIGIGQSCRNGVAGG